ncbi:MAG: hypothetical protein JRJ02_13355 [Deltaproteobacteria bacterium]|nr:hypothetical protein [Deltaproteobacteria bacterium]
MEKSFISKLFLIILLGFVVLLFWLFYAYISSILLALLIASAFFPLFSLLNKALKGRERIAALIMSLIILLILIIPVSWFIGTLSNEAFDFYDRTRNSVSLQKIQQALEGDSPGGRFHLGTKDQEGGKPCKHPVEF